ncbi:MAG: DNA-binding protein [Planctomycetota bacterium]|nr:MAG: DNA-binding protein [Planctomycetota bacterium]
MAKAATAAKKSPSKSEVMNNIAEETGLTKKQVSAVFDALNGEIKKALSNRGPGVFAIPGLVKVEKKKVPARPAQKNVPNPFKPGEFMDRPAKPASVKVKVRALKNLKDMV